MFLPKQPFFVYLILDCRMNYVEKQFVVQYIMMPLPFIEI
jgi:hypothetical protein